MAFHQCMLDRYTMTEEPYLWCALHGATHCALLLRETGLRPTYPLPVACFQAGGVSGQNHWRKHITVSLREAAMLAGEVASLTYILSWIPFSIPSSFQPAIFSEAAWIRHRTTVCPTFLLKQQTGVILETASREQTLSLFDRIPFHIAECTSSSVDLLVNRSMAPRAAGQMAQNKGKSCFASDTVTQVSPSKDGVSFQFQRSCKLIHTPQLIHTHTVWSIAG